MSFRLAFCALLLAFALPASSSATHPPDLFDVYWALPGHEVASHAMPDHARGFRLRPGALSQKRLAIELFDHEPIVATQLRRVVRSGGSITWLGEVEGYPGSHVSLTLHRGRIAGSILFGAHQFEITTDAHGSYFFEVEVDALPPAPSPIGGEYDPDGGAPPTSAASFVHDLLVVYTPASRARYTQSGIETKILDAIASANQAYQNSQIDLQLQLVHMQEIAYTETGDMGVSLERLQRTGDGYMDSVHALRDQVGADLVALIDEDSNYCGIAYVMQGEALSFANWAFSVTYSACLANQTLAHEIGHNQGDAHDRASSNVPGTFDFSYGHRRCVNDGFGFRTIMSYSCSGGNRVQHFSNPAVSWNEHPTGIDHAVDPENSADNARSMGLTADTVAAWRDTVAASPPAAPSGLAAAAASFERIDVSWTDASNDENGFRLERSSGGAAWTEIATLAANTTSYQDTGLAPSSSHAYRVRAYNGQGNSAYSNVDSATTNPPPPAPDTPAGVAASALSGSEIRVTWNDVANETRYTVEHSPDGASFSAAATLGADATAWTDTGLDLGSTHHYRVIASGLGGDSGPSAAVTATTATALEIYAGGETPTHGSVSGNVADTWAADGSLQTITEQTTGGKPSRRESRLEHAWSFDVPPATSVVLELTASASGAGPDDFSFELSTDGGGSFTPLLVVSNASPSEQMALLPGAPSGAVTIRVIDTNRSGGETLLDAVHVDALILVAESDPNATPPAAPGSASATAMSATRVDVHWTDASSDEMGFEIERATGGGPWLALGSAAAEASQYSDATAAPNTAYSYRVRAFNGAGSSAWVAAPSVTTPQGLALSATGYKTRGQRYADLVWSGAGTTDVEVLRDGASVAITPNDGAHTDAIPGKGSGSFQYQVCETGGGSCSASVLVGF
jgi:hypothetical protein